MKILIIAGGSSSERKISLISAKMVKVGLLANRHQVTIFDFKKGYKKLKSALALCDIVFPVMHGKEGEDGRLYSFLKSARKPFVGADPNGARIAFDKILFKKYCRKIKIIAPRWKAVKNPADISKFGFPSVLKGAYGGSSHEVVILRSSRDILSAKVKKLFKSDNKFFVEELVSGTEITIGVLLNKALPVVEIIPPKNKWFDYKNKYSGETREIPFAPSVSQRIQKEVQKIALRIHKDLKLGSFSRTDIIVQKNIPYVLETNTPGGVGLTPNSLFPKAAKAAGLTFESMLELIIKRGLINRV